MKKKYITQWLTLVMAVLVGALPVHGGQAITIVTDEFPPFNYIEDGRVAGLGTEVVRAVLKKADMDAEIKVYPWARAYKMALSHGNVLIYTIVRSPEREHLFKWVGLVAENNACLFALAARNINIHAMADARKYRIGAVRKDVRTEHLLALGFENIEQVSKNELNLKKLVSHRLDLWLEDELTAHYLLKKNGYIPGKKIKNVFRFQVRYKGYLALSRRTPDAVVEKLKNAYDKIITDGTYDMILQKYP
jgi:polar amino acid transport system substrate-binding protein